MTTPTCRVCVLQISFTIGESFTRRSKLTGEKEDEIGEKVSEITKDVNVSIQRLPRNLTKRLFAVKEENVVEQRARARARHSTTNRSPPTSSVSKKKKTTRREEGPKAGDAN